MSKSSRIKFRLGIYITNDDDGDPSTRIHIGGDILLSGTPEQGNTDYLDVGGTINDYAIDTTQSGPISYTIQGTMFTDCPAPDGSQTAYSGELIGFTMSLQCGENTPEGNALITFTSRDVTGEFIGTSLVTEHVAGMVICEGAVELPGLDTDFDGIPDLSDSCPTIPNTGIDRDNDGIDDACDTSPAPVTPGQPPKGPIVITPPGQPSCTGPGCRG